MRLVVGEVADPSPRVDTAQKQRLAADDVADAGHHALIHQRLTDGTVRVESEEPCCGHSPGVEGVVEQVGADRGDPGDRLARFVQPQAWPAVLRRDVGLGPERKPQIALRDRSGRRQQSPRADHAQMRVQNPPAHEPQQVVFADRIHTLDRVTGKALGDPLWHHARLGCVDPYQCRPGERGRQADRIAVADMSFGHQGVISVRCGR